MVETDYSIPPKYATASPAGCDTLTRKHCEELASGKLPERGILYMGPAGTGKSYAMYCVARCAGRATFNGYAGNGTVIYDSDRPRMRPSKTVAVIKFRTLLQLFHAGTFNRGENIADIITSLCENWCLFIDDMTVRTQNQAAESPYRWAYEAVNALADTWWDKSQSGGLYITTNNSKQELADAFGTPLMDRIRGLCDRVELSGASKR